MKRKISLLLVAVVLLTCFSGCANRGASGKPSGDKSTEPSTLTVLVEDTFSIEDFYENAYHYLYGDNVDIVYEFLSSDPAEREAQLTSIRASIMAGEGPDVFMLPTWVLGRFSDDAGNPIEPNEPLFVDLEDNMRNGIFLVLDDYIENSEHFNMEDHNSLIMDVGKTNEGQVVLPLMYSYELMFLDKSLMDDPDVAVNTIDDLVNCGDDDLLYTLQGSSFRWVNSVFTNMVDYNSDELLITQEEIKKVFTDVAQIYNSKAGHQDIKHTMEIGDDEFSYIDTNSFNVDLFYGWKTYEDEVYPLAIPNQDGGITALVTAYTAINRNTQNPQAAFNFVEMMYRDEIQSGKGIYVEEDGFYKWSDMGPQSVFIGSTGGIGTSSAVFSDSVLYDTDKIKQIESRITAVRFTSKYDRLISDAWYDNLHVFEFNIGDEDTFDEIATNLYTEFKMIFFE